LRQEELGREAATGRRRGGGEKSFKGGTEEKKKILVYRAQRTVLLPYREGGEKQGE